MDMNQGGGRNAVGCGVQGRGRIKGENCNSIINKKILKKRVRNRGEKVQGRRSIISRHKIDGER